MDRPIDAPPLRWLLGNREQRSLARRYWVWETLQGFGHLALHYSTRALPIDTCSALGEWVGRKLSRAAMPEADRRAHENWARLRPTEADRAEAITDYAFGQTGRLHWEFAILDQLIENKRITVEGNEHLVAAQAAGRPVLIAGLHLSNWEVIGPALAQSGHKVTAIYQQPPNRFDHHIVVTSRQRWGCELVPPNAAGARPAYRTLTDRKRVLVIYVDECIDEYVYAPFFGRPLRLDGNMTRAARLAAMADAVLIPCYVLRREGAYFHTVFMPPIDLVRSADREADLAENVARINATVEPVIRKHLDQWFWLFDRIDV